MRKSDDLKRRNPFFLSIHILLILLITVSVHSIFVTTQTQKFLHGEFDQYLQPGVLFAAPSNIADHGFVATKFVRPGDTGWDGQFYYYLADDPLLLKDTSAHLDWPQYRSQRIGFAFFTYVASRVTGQSWVSPKFYFAMTALLILVATGMLATYIESNGKSPYMALLWSIGGAPMFSLLYGFVDAMGDAFAVIALITLLRKRWWWYVLAMTLATLTRESLVLFPLAIAGVIVLNQVVLFAKKEETASLISIVSRMLLHSIPVLFVITWHVYIQRLFGGVELDGKSYPFYMLPLKNLMGPPMLATLDFMTGGYLRQYLPIFNTGRSITFVWQQAIGLAFFMVMIILSAYGVLQSLRMSVGKSMSFNTQERELYAGILFGLLASITLYSCFGPDMVWAPIGYVKASGMFAIALCFFAIQSNKYVVRVSVCVIALATVYYSQNIWHTLSIG